jgi:hypothetical protein
MRVGRYIKSDCFENVLDYLQELCMWLILTRWKKMVHFFAKNNIFETSDFSHFMEAWNRIFKAFAFEAFSILDFFLGDSLHVERFMAEQYNVSR